MTVKELINELSKYPDDIEVYLNDKFGDPNGRTRSVKLYDFYRPYRLVIDSI